MQLYWSLSKNGIRSCIKQIPKKYKPGGGGGSIMGILQPKRAKGTDW
jgi:hypothetical protein